MTISIVNHGSVPQAVDGTGKIYTLTLPSSATAGNALFITVPINSGGGFSSCFTNLGDAVSLDYADTTNNIWYLSVSNVTGSPTTLTLTASTSYAISGTIGYEEVSGVGTSTYVTQTTLTPPYASSHFTVSFTTTSASAYVRTCQKFGSSAGAVTSISAGYSSDALGSIVDLYSSAVVTAGAQSFTFNVANVSVCSGAVLEYSLTSSTPSFPSASSKRFNNQRHSFGLRS